MINDYIFQFIEVFNFSWQCFVAFSVEVLHAFHYCLFLDVLFSKNLKMMSFLTFHVLFVAGI